MSLASLRARARAAVSDPRIARPFELATARARARRAASVARLPDWEQQRHRAAEIRRDSVERLEPLLDRFEQVFTGAGGTVWRAVDAEQACRIVVDILTAAGARTAVKAKSMATEEVELSSALQAAGIDPLETDLGEFIVQLAGQRPSHITAPAIHLTRQQIGRLFARALGAGYTEDPAELTAIARRALRQRFLTADAGISGANFLVAETGQIVLFENEANIRMCTTLPRVHVTVAGVEKVIARRADLAPLTTVLPRSATGQEAGTYLSVLGGAGPPQRHVVLLDNGRRRLRDQPGWSELLACVRCGACLNACPVFERMGGHAYGSVYSGPIGSLLAPHGIGIQAHEGAALPFASSLCGACRDACPVEIDLPELLRKGRERYAHGTDTQPPSASWWEGAVWGMWAAVLARPRLYARISRWGRALGIARGVGTWLPAWAVPAAREWARGRALPQLAPHSFHEQWRRRMAAAGAADGPGRSGP